MKLHTRDSLSSFVMDRGAVMRVRKLKSVELRDAVIAGKSDQVAVLLVSNNMDPEGKGLQGNSPLFYAAEAGNSVIVGLLITAGANVNRCSGFLQSTALHAACEGRMVEVVRQLLAAGADPSKTDGDSQTPLHSACYGGSTRVVTKLLRTGIGWEDRNDSGATPLSVAVAHGHFNVVDILLTAGADVNAVGRNGYTPLHVASAQGHFNIVVELLLAGAYPSPRHKQTDETPLFIAARAGLGDIIRSLLHAHANPLLKTNGLTPLDIATHKTHVSVMREFLQYPGLLTNSDMAYNALRLAAAGGLSESVAVLLHAGVNPKLEVPAGLSESGDFGDNGGCPPRLRVPTPIEEAQRYGHDGVLRQLNRAWVDDGSEESNSSDADLGTTSLFATTLVDEASTALLAYEGDSDLSSSTGGLASLLGGEEIWCNDYARKRDPERRVRFNLSDTPAVEIVEAFPLSPVVAEVFVEETNAVGAIMPSADCHVLEGDETKAGGGSVLCEEHTLRKEVQTLDEKVERLEKEVHQLNVTKERAPPLGDENPASDVGDVPQHHEQDANISATAGDSDGGGSTKITAAAPNAQHAETNGQAADDMVQCKKKATQKATKSRRKGWRVVVLGQAPMHGKTLSWLGMKGTLRGRLRREPGSQATDEGGNEQVRSCDPTQQCATVTAEGAPNL